MYLHPSPKDSRREDHGDVPHQERLSSGLAISYNEELEGRDVWWEWNPESGQPITLAYVQSMTMLEAHDLFKTFRTSFWSRLNHSGVVIMLPSEMAPAPANVLRLHPFHYSYQEERAGNGGLKMSPGYALWWLARHCASVGEGRGMQEQVVKMEVDPSGRVYLKLAEKS